MFLDIFPLSLALLALQTVQAAINWPKGNGKGRHIWRRVKGAEVGAGATQLADGGRPNQGKRSGYMLKVSEKLLNQCSANTTCTAQKRAD